MILSRKPASWDEFFAALKGESHKYPRISWIRPSAARNRTERDPFDRWRA